MKKKIGNFLFHNIKFWQYEFICYMLLCKVLFIGKLILHKRDKKLGKFPHPNPKSELENLHKIKIKKQFNSSTSVDHQAAKTSFLSRKIWNKSLHFPQEFCFFSIFNAFLIAKLPCALLCFLFHFGIKKSGKYKLGSLIMKFLFAMCIF